MTIDTYADDPARWGHSFANLSELFLPCLDAVGARSVVEVGAYAGALTGVLVEWARGSGARVVAIDPQPQPELVELAQRSPGLELVRERSLDALGRIELPDVVIVDGDHNYWTVSEELRAIAAGAGDSLPLLLFHDVLWPHGRRDAYYTPESVPAEHRQPLKEGGGLFPGDPGTRPGALPYRWPAAREGGPRNGVLTAVEDFVADRDGLRLAVVPAFFGLGAVWPQSAPWSDAVAEILDPWDHNPILARLEDNRVRHLALRHVHQMEATAQYERLARKAELLRRITGSRAFHLAQRLTAVGRRGRPIFSEDQLRRALDD